MQKEMKSNIRLHRVKSGISQDQVACILGVSRQTYLKYERGEVLPNIWVADKLASIFACTVYDLFVMDSACNYEYELHKSYSEGRDDFIDSFTNFKNAAS